LWEPPATPPSPSLAGLAVPGRLHRVLAAPKTRSSSVSGIVQSEGSALLGNRSSTPRPGVQHIAQGVNGLTHRSAPSRPQPTPRPQLQPQTIARVRPKYRRGFGRHRWPRRPSLQTPPPGHQISAAPGTVYPALVAANPFSGAVSAQPSRAGRLPVRACIITSGKPTGASAPSLLATRYTLRPSPTDGLPFRGIPSCQGSTRSWTSPNATTSAAAASALQSPTLPVYGRTPPFYPPPKNQPILQGPILTQRIPLAGPYAGPQGPPTSFNIVRDTSKQPAGLQGPQKKP